MCGVTPDIITAERFDVRGYRNTVFQTVGTWRAASYNVNLYDGLMVTSTFGCSNSIFHIAIPNLLNKSSTTIVAILFRFLWFYVCKDNYVFGFLQINDLLCHPNYKLT